MAVDAKQYLNELLTEAGVAPDDPKRQAVLEALGNEKAAQRLAADVSRQSDYSRAMDELRKKENETKAYYASLLETTAKNQEAVNQWARTVERYKSQYGDLDASGEPRTVQTPTGDFISKKEYEDMKKAADANYIGLLKVTTKLSGKHWQEFNEPLPVDELEKLAVEQNISLEQAYDRHTAPRRAEKQKLELEQQLAKAREEGAREFASKHKLPVDSAPREYHTIYDRDPKKQVGVDDYVPGSGQLSPNATRALREGFAESWNSAQEATSGT